MGAASCTASGVDRPLSSSLFEWALTAADSTAVLLPRDGAVTERTWREVADDVLRMIAYLHGAGVRRGDRVALWSDNRYEWIVIDLAILSLGAIHVPLHGSLTAAAAAAQLAHAEPKLALVAADWMRQGLQKYAGQLPVVDGPLEVIDGMDGRAGLMARSARASVDEGVELTDQAAEEFDPEQIATILYSSGTSGEPKAVALTQANLISNCQAVVSVFQESRHERRLNLLPFSHIYARTCDLYTWLMAGSQLALARSRETAYADCAATEPTMMNAVPFFYGRVMQNVIESERQGEPISIRDLLGPRIRICTSGGAPLPVSTFDFFHERGVLLLPGYGLTESSPVISMSTPDSFRRGAVGRLIPGIEVRIAEDGELLTRGPHVMKEYWKSPELTLETIRDGWLYTGDLGAVDADGFVSITGRKKELLALSTGKKAAPTYIEGLMCQDPLLQQAMVVGNDRPYLAAIVVPNLQLLAERLRADAADVDLGSAEAGHAVQQAIAAQLHELPACEQVKRFTLVSRAFTLDEGMLTPKMSLRRDVIQRAFQQEIDSLYEGGGVAVRYAES
ncbi:MAG: long-chain fatty acid--CoA ligase [Pirellulales bacterium]|nr:long-chain fatty acid--CoA ligase [Pirellulales bacterium]